LKIILSNYRYFDAGGPERYLFSVKKAFKNKGIKIYPFSVKSKRNHPTQWDKFFLSPVSSNDAVFFHEYKKDIKTRIKVLERAFYSPEGFYKAWRYAGRTEADIVYSLQFLNKMSPSVLDGFKSAGLPVIVRLSDFGLICPQPTLFCNGKICESWIGSSSLSCAKKKCFQNSYLATMVKSLALTFQKQIGSFSRIDAFICPSKFTRQKYIEAGFPGKKIHYIPTFIQAEDIAPNFSHDGYILYFGRVVEEKGVHVLLKAWELIKGKRPKLIVVGNLENNKYHLLLKKRYSHAVRFIDFLPKKELYQFIENSMFVIVPSIWYDNLPNALLESYAHGKAVIASRHGCFPEFVKEKETGLLFSPGNAEALADKLNWAINNQGQMADMGKNARKYVEKHFPENLHVNRLIALFRSVLKSSKK